ncbi:hypothetical protein PCC79_16000 [Propioniciclava soli]|uniref:ABC3 transporter permease C-terminal domain-containing protein n=1 Tax=Propioniciclava soli TaxID=2775081 RepID=A0ABZ3C827_9ACTN
MRKVYAAELRDSWPAWLGVSLAFVITNLSFVNSALVLRSGWAAVAAGKIDMMDSADFTLTPVSNFVFSGIVGLTVIATSTSMVVDSRRGSLARLGVAGAAPGQIVSSIMTQLVAVSVLSALIANIIAAATLDPFLHFLTVGVESGLVLEQPAPVYDVGVMVLANAVCIGVALLGGYGQARRAATIPPVEALRQAVAAPGERMTVLRWIGAALCVVVIVALFAGIFVMMQFRTSETVSTLMQMALAALLVFTVLVAMVAPLLIGPLARGWTALVPFRGPTWQIARKNVYVRGSRFSRSVVPIVFTIALMLGLLSLGPTIFATSAASGFEGGPITLDKAGMGAFLSLLGPALAIALAGGVGNLFMMSKQRDAELALFGITGATPTQRRVLPILEAIILTVTATIPAVLALALMLTYLYISFTGAGLVAVLSVPLSAWVVGVGATGLIMVAATFLPTLSALRLPEPRVVARLAAE